MERSSFFNAILDQEGNPDRSYLAEDFARYFATFIGNGVFPNPAKQLQVVAVDNNMQIRIKKGFAWINGYMYQNTDDLVLPVDVADGVLDRIDRIVLRLDFLKRKIKIIIKKGEWSSNAVAPTLQRNADMYELALADIYVSAGAIRISQAYITDLRLNKSLCGIVHGTVDQVDTTAIFNQFQSWYSTTKDNYDKDMATWTTNKKQAFEEWYTENTSTFLKQWNSWYGNNTTQWENDFINWFDTIKGRLDGDIATKLTAKTIELEKKINILSGDSGEYEKVNKSDFDNFKEENETQLAESTLQIQNNKNEINNLKFKDTELENKIDNIDFVERKTYTELKQLKDNKQLKEGKKYILTDYATKYIQPTTNVLKEMSIEELILTASGINSFEPIVYSPSYPSDTIWFDFDNNVCEDNSTPRNGFILRRYDSISGNDCPQDWRSMLWARWKPDANQYYKNGVLTNYSVWTGGNAVMGVIYRAGSKLLVAKNTNIPSDSTDSSVFDTVYLDINISTLFLSRTKVFHHEDGNLSIDLQLTCGELGERKTFSENCIHNEIGLCDALHNNVILNNSSNNTLRKNCKNNTLNDKCNDNIFENDCINNCLYDGTRRQNFGASCSNNVIYDSISNHFELGCSSNFLYNCSYNIFMPNNVRNILFDSSFNYFGISCTSNKLNSYCMNNIFKNRCLENSLAHQSTRNYFGVDCQYNTFAEYTNLLRIKTLNNKDVTELGLNYNYYIVNIEQNKDKKFVYWYLDSNNRPVYTEIP